MPELTATDSTKYAATVLERCDALAAFTEERARITRRFATPALREAGEAVRKWMEAAGMVSRRDAIGNVIGRIEGTGDGTLLIGSHLDTVRDAGRYDGMLGVLVGIACVERLRDAGRSLPYAVEVLGFADEEGVRYGTAYLGSSVIAGRFDLAALERCDADGVRMDEALRAFGGAPERLMNSKREPADLIGYYEVHIEQGPVLEAENLSLGVVSAIAGQTRATVSFSGEAGHAGTVPMTLRRDAVCAAAEWILATEALAREEDGLVATTSELAVQPGASNVIPSSATLSLDLRHGEDAVRSHASERLRRRAAAVADSRGVTSEWRIVQETPAVTCSRQLTATLSEAIAAAGHPVTRLASGAGHDAAILATIAPVSMLFVRCAGGVSHNPAESVRIEDVAAAIDASTRFLELLA
jgi:allantoate deiminase